MPARVPEHITAEIVRFLRQGMKATEVQDELRKSGFKIAASTISRHALRLGIALTPGARKGAPSAGRPKKSSERRAGRTVWMDPKIWSWLDAEKRAGETTNDALERILGEFIART